MGPFQIYTPLAKVAPHKREVTGVLTQEMPDHDGEIMDYDSSKPYFMAWSNMVHQDTQGKSKGNLRVMHQPQVAGKITDIRYDDAAKAIHVTAKVSDDQQWKKVLNGEYTGFSVGGHYVDKWEDDQVLSSGKKAVRFTADPYEASLVDRPSVSSALFTSVKMIKMITSDGHEEDVPLSELAAKAAGSETPDALDGFLDALTKRIARRNDVDPKDGADQYGNVEFADPTNKKYPIDTEEHIRAAWNYINKDKDASKYSPEEVSEIKSKIIAAWKRKIDAKGPPSAREGRKYINPIMAKGLMRAGQLVACIENLAEFAQGQVFEDRVEEQMGQSGKPSKLPKKVLSTIKDLIPVLQQYIQEESEELLTQVAEATSSEAQKMSGNSGSTGDALSRFDAVTKGVNDLVALLKAAKKDDDKDEKEEKRKKEEAEKARKAREEGDDDEDEKEAGISDEEKKARKQRNEKRAEKRKEKEAASTGGDMRGGEQPRAPQSSNGKAAGDNEALLKGIEALTSAVKETMEKSANDMDVLKGVILMQAQEIQNLQSRVARKSAPLVPVNSDRFQEAYLAKMGRSASSGEGSFSDALKGIYAQARGE